MKRNANGLMGDLESIKALLEEDDIGPVPESSEADGALAPAVSADQSDAPVEEEAPAAEHDDTYIPLLSDALDLNASIDTSLDTSASALLGEAFHTATANALASAREQIDAQPTQWSPQQTDELADALRVRIDGAVKQWINASLAAHTSELEKHLLGAVQDELDQHLLALREPQ